MYFDVTEFRNVNQFSLHVLIQCSLFSDKFLILICIYANTFANFSRISLSRMSSKKRKYDDSYIQFGFTSVVIDGMEKPQCVLCNKVLSNDSMRPAKLKQHLENVHPQSKHKDKSYFERQSKALKMMRLDNSGEFFIRNSKIVEASYEVALEIAKQKKPHTIGESLIKPCVLKMADKVLGKDAEKKLAAVPLSNNTIQRRISDMSNDIKTQVVQQIKDAPFGLFAIQLDESTDVSSCAQLMVFVKYIYNSAFKEEFLFCSALEINTKATDIFEKASSFFESEDLEWQNLAGCCTDGAPAMLGCHSGFQTLVKQLALTSKGVHCMLHRQALASKTLPDSIQTVLEQMVQIVNFIKAGALNSRVFKKLCSDMDADHLVLLYHTQTRWLSKGNVTRRFFELKEEVKAFCELKNKSEFCSSLDDEEWMLFLAYLCDIFEQLNKLNLQMQGKNTNIIKFVDALKAFKSKLSNWKRKIRMHNYSMFEKLDMLVDHREIGLPVQIKSDILEHLSSLESEFERYFPEISYDELDFVRNPFTFSVEKVSDECQDEFLDLVNDSSAKQVYHEKLLTEFWIEMKTSYSKITEKALRVLIPFVSTYLCEAGFSTLLQIKTKQRNKLHVEDDLRCALSQTSPRIQRLSNDKQKQVSH